MRGCQMRSLTMLTGGHWFASSALRRIDQIQLDFRFGLVLDDGTLIVIESPFVATIDGVVTEVIPFDEAVEPPHGSTRHISNVSRWQQDRRCQGSRSVRAGR